MEISLGVLVVVQFFAGLANLIAGVIMTRFAIKYKEENNFKIYLLFLLYIKSYPQASVN